MNTPGIAVVGAGAFGRNHLRVYHALQQESASLRLVAAVDPIEANRLRASAEWGIPAFPTLHDLFHSGLVVDAASICTPTVHHAATALALLAAHTDVLVEKPISATLHEADQILAAARQHGRIVAVGHLERFNPAVTAAASLVHRPMFFESHRLSIFTPRSLDVDVVLDLMIHDLDIVLHFAASPVHEVRAVGLPVLSRKTDIANVRIEFGSGAVANFTASRISTERIRKLRFFQPQQYLSLDFARQDLLRIDLSAAASLTPAFPTALASLPPAASLTPAEIDALLAKQTAAPTSATQHPTPGLSLQKVPTAPAEPLRLEIEDFLQAVRTRRAPRVTAEQARAALALALDINQAIAAHANRTGLA